MAADADDPAVVDREDERKHKLEAQAARHHDTLDIFAEQVRRHGKTRQGCDMMVLNHLGRVMTLATASPAGTSPDVASAEMASIVMYQLLLRVGGIDFHTPVEPCLCPS